MEQIIIDTPRNWDAVSTGYAESVAPLLIAPFADEFIDRLEPARDSNALEVACGSGALTLTLARAVGSLLAVDFAPKMIQRARQRTMEAGISNVDFEIMDGQSLELESDSMDLGASSFGLMLFPNRMKGFNELKRVVRPGGRVVVSGWAGPSRFEAFDIFLRAMQRAIPDMPPPSSPPPVFSLADAHSFAGEMRSAGFRDVQVDYVAKQLTVDGPEAVWAMVTAGAPPVKKLFDRVGEEGKIRIHEALDRIVRERYGNGPITLLNTATIGVGSV